jgi:RNA-directed DNA polymerase
METWTVHQLSLSSRHLADEATISDLKMYASRLKRRKLPVIFTLKHLSKISGVDYTFLRRTVERRREFSNYKMFAIKKRSGGRRHIHSLTEQLLQVQRFINSEILKYVDVSDVSYAFSREGGIRNCATQHCGARWILKFDLENFFYSVTETDVYYVFISLGYRPLLAFEMARICTTLRLPNHLKYLLKGPEKFDRAKKQKLYQIPKRGYTYGKPELTLSDLEALMQGRPLEYKRDFQPSPLGVLPQGAPTSPMLSNLVARKLDEKLIEYSDSNYLVYTRYADDLVFSSSDLNFDPKNIAKIQRDIAKIIKESGYRVNSSKTRVAGPGARKMVLGLLVDGNTPRLSKDMVKRIDRHLYSIEKYGISAVSDYNGFDSVYGFYNHLSGLIAFTKDVDIKRWKSFHERFRNISTPR